VYADIPRGGGKQLVESGGGVLFDGYDFAYGQEIWVSDGTVDGTQLRIDLAPGYEQGAYEPMILGTLSGSSLVTETLFSTGDDYFHSLELWKVGRPAGKVLLGSVRSESGEFSLNFQALSDRATG